MEADGAVIRLVTRCTSAEEFIERFARFTTTTDIVVPALPHVSAGTSGHFVICLKDRSVMMQGRCEVTEIQPVVVAPGAATPSSLTALMHLRLREMDAHSCGIHLRLIERRESWPPQPPVVVEAVPTPVPALDISAVTVVREGRPPSDTEPTAISPPPRPETRVPGAAFTLPANPLSDLDAVDLASFVEETLLESKGAVAAVPIDSGAIVDDSAQADPDPWPVTSPGRASDARQHRVRRIIRSAALYGSCVLGGLLVGNGFRPGAKAPPVVVVAPDFVQLPVAAPPSTASAPVNAIPAPAPRDCVARVTTKPAGAAVSWGDIALGSSPIERAAIPCGTATVTLRREHYADVTRTLTTERGQSAVVAERLIRPSASVVVTSSPAHAVIKVNKRRVGSAPRTISALQFERVRIEASLPGYQPWRKTLYLKEAESQVDVRLVRLAEANAGRPTPPSVPPAHATPPPPVGAPAAVAAR